MPELAPGHRVSRPRGTGSVGDGVGEGAMTTHAFAKHSHVQQNIARAATVHRSYGTPLLLMLLEGRNAVFAIQVRACARAHLLCVRACVPSPTLSPTDPVPRGLLTLCPWASSGPQDPYTAYIQPIYSLYAAYMQPICSLYTAYIQPIYREIEWCEVSRCGR